MTGIVLLRSLDMKKWVSFWDNKKSSHGKMKNPCEEDGFILYASDTSVCKFNQTLFIKMSNGTLECVFAHVSFSFDNFR